MKKHSFIIAGLVVLASIAGRENVLAQEATTEESLPAVEEKPTGATQPPEVLHLPTLDIPDTQVVAGREVRIPVRVVTGPSDLPGVYGGGIALAVFQEMSDGSEKSLPLDFEAAGGVIALVNHVRDEADYTVVVFAAVPAIRNAVVGYFVVTVPVAGRWVCGWESSLKTDLNPGNPNDHAIGSATLIGLPPFSVEIRPNRALVGDEVVLSIADGTAPFSVPRDFMDPKGLFRAVAAGEREFKLVPDTLGYWPEGQHSVDVMMLVSDQDNNQVAVKFTARARKGDVDEDNVVTIVDVVLMLNQLIDPRVFDNYQRVVEDVDDDGNLTLNDAILTLFIVLDMAPPSYGFSGGGGHSESGPVPASGDSGSGSGSGKSAGGVTDQVRENARRALADLAGDFSPGAEQARQLIYTIIGSGAATVAAEIASTPAEFGLEQNYPNPFNAATTIGYTVAEAGEVTLTVYAFTGQKVVEIANGFHASGRYTAVWNADVASGNYFYVLKASDFQDVRKMTLLK